MNGRRSLWIGCLLIAMGTGWLLTAMGVAPGVDWMWTLGVAAVGVLTFIVGGFDKVTFVVGTFFIAASTFSVLRQTNQLKFDIEVPLLVMTGGVLLVLSNLPLIPEPTWMKVIRDEAERSGQQRSNSPMS